MTYPELPKSEFEFAEYEQSGFKRYFLTVLERYTNYYTGKKLYRVRLDDERGNVEFATFNYDSLIEIWRKRTGDEDDLSREVERNESAV